MYMYMYMYMCIYLILILNLIKVPTILNGLISNNTVTASGYGGAIGIIRSYGRIFQTKVR